jgi:hypothetical protein
MSVSLYSATVPLFLQILPQIGALLDKAEAHCRENGLAPETILNARLAEDMWPLSWQIRSCWLQSADAVDSAISGERSPDFSDIPPVFAPLKQGIAGAIARLEAVKPADVDCAEGNDVSFKVRDMSLEFTATDYLLHFALPNFYFHSSMAYAILRNQGFAIGKRDYLGALRVKG